MDKQFFFFFLTRRRLFSTPHSLLAFRSVRRRKPAVQQVNSAQAVVAASLAVAFMAVRRGQRTRETRE